MYTFMRLLFRPTFRGQLCLCEKCYWYIVCEHFHRFVNLNIFSAIKYIIFRIKYYILLVNLTARINKSHRFFNDEQNWTNQVNDCIHLNKKYMPCLVSFLTFCTINHYPSENGLHCCMCCTDQKIDRRFHCHANVLPYTHAWIALTSINLTVH